MVGTYEMRFPSVRHVEERARSSAGERMISGGIYFLIGRIGSGMHAAPVASGSRSAPPTAALP